MVEKIAFVKPSRVVEIDPKQRRIDRFSFYDGKVLGTSDNRTAGTYDIVGTITKEFCGCPHLPGVGSVRMEIRDSIGNRENLEKMIGAINNFRLVSIQKQVPRKWTLKSELSVKPQFYSEFYREYPVESAKSCQYVSELKDEFGQRVANEVVKNNKTVWKLVNNREFRWTNPPEMLHNYFDPVRQDKKQPVPFDQRPFKEFSRFSANKIAAKLEVWYLNELARANYDPSKVNFKFITFTVTKPDFSHELTVRAWKNFISNMSQNYGSKFQFLWVAELQTGKRALEKAQYYFKKYQAGIEPEKYKKLYDEWTDRGLNPTNNIHYHMVVDRHFDIQTLNNLWLTCLENQGAPAFNAEGKRYNPVQLSKRKKKDPKTGKFLIDQQTGKFILEDTKFDMMLLIRYVAKYMTKQADEGTGKGLRCALWHCSRMVSKFATSKYKAFHQVAPLYIHAGTGANGPAPLPEGQEFRDRDNIATKHYVK